MAFLINPQPFRVELIDRNSQNVLDSTPYDVKTTFSPAVLRKYIEVPQNCEFEVRLTIADDFEHPQQALGPGRLTRLHMVANVYHQFDNEETRGFRFLIPQFGEQDHSTREFVLADELDSQEWNEFRRLLFFRKGWSWLLGESKIVIEICLTTRPFKSEPLDIPLQVFILDLRHQAEFERIFHTLWVKRADFRYCYLQRALHDGYSYDGLDTLRKLDQPPLRHLSKRGSRGPPNREVDKDFDATTSTSDSSDDLLLQSNLLPCLPSKQTTLPPIGTGRY